MHCDNIRPTSPATHYTITHTAIGAFPFWYHLETWQTEHIAVRRANEYVLNHGGYVCVKDDAGTVVFGTDPAALDRAITAGTNRSFPRETARRAGYCV